jgi:hypothetical protein
MKSLLQGLCNEQSRPALKPEERLLLAVVESAYWDLQSPDPTKRRIASTYFLDDKDHHAFSFVSICQHFSWSPGSIRYQLGTLLGPEVDDDQVHLEAARAGMRHSATCAVR